MSAEICQKLVESLKKRGFEAEYAATREDAVSLALAEAVDAKSVGWGGSETVKELGLREAIADAGKEIRDHQLEMDLFLLSANAVTLDGRIVNIDGRGNRVAASIAGPKRVVYLIGRNKIVDGGIDAAIDRIKRFACAPNCRRLGKRTPCAETGVCADCDSPDRICKVTAVFDRKPTGVSAKVIVIDADLGY
ncbi:MAG: lactate utilization protein [Kiritimatiellae bacterium]|nr:lactate utilization protein [Kiritimatiellia bacterium]